jgi:hypothetical protein
MLSLVIFAGYHAEIYWHWVDVTLVQLLSPITGVLCQPNHRTNMSATLAGLVTPPGFLLLKPFWFWHGYNFLNLNGSSGGSFKAALAYR